MKGASKTRVVYQANLNFRTVNPYLELLMKNDLIVASNQGPRVVYETTEKGTDLMKTIEQVHSTLIEYQEPVPSSTSA